MKYLILTLFLLSTLAQAESLKILSWNIYMIPKPLLWTHQMVRAAEIGNQLADSEYDVIFFQEAFAPATRKKIWKKLRDKFPHESGTFKKRRFLTVLNSGLWAMSRYPLTVLDHVYFDECSGTDCYATKGALLIELQLPDCKIQIAGTHMQAWPGAKQDQIRFSQLTQMRNMLDEFRQQGIDQIVLGDLNLDNYNPEYDKTINELLDTSSSPLMGPIRYSAYEASNSHTDKKIPELLDYILLRNDSSTGSKIKNKMLRKRTMVRKGEPLDLSDHYGIEAEIEFAKPEIPLLSKSH